MSDFEELAVSEQPNYENGRWRSSGLGDWVYIIDGYIGKDGGIYTSKSKSDKPFQIRVRKDSLKAFAQHILDTNKKVNGDDGNSDLGF